MAYIYNSRGAFQQNVDSGEVWASRLLGGYKLDVYNWLEGYNGQDEISECVEVRFKNTRKGFYQNVNRLSLRKGDIVAVESSPGHDIGIIALTGDLVRRKMKKGGFREPPEELRKVYRKAKPGDIEKWYSSIELENVTMLRARQIAISLKLEMKVSDVEFQGDRTKAIFYYISDARVDFRELIKLYADEFKIRIEMKQIGARQEAGRMGGIGSCGRELCCSTWMSHFVSVSTSAARYQEVSLNPQKLAGQCAKLKCCLNYELKCYLEAQQNFPSSSVALETEQGDAFHRKTDVFRRIMWYSFEKEADSASLIPLDVDTVQEIIELNKKGIKAKQLFAAANVLPAVDEIGYQNAVGEDSISRFEEQTKKKKKKKSGRPDGFRGNKQQVGIQRQGEETVPNVEVPNRGGESHQGNARRRFDVNRTHNQNQNQNQRKSPEPIILKKPNKEA